ncbi:MAG: biotin synthase [Clostridia bacterium]|nr:biotin synthase [Clostridia bacterium]
MTQILIPKKPDTEVLLETMAEDMQYEIGCSAETLRNTGVDSAMQIKAKQTPCAPVKLGLCGHCAFNCAYCVCRNGNDRPEYVLEPAQLAQIAVEVNRKTGNGVFITSAIYKTPDITQERIAETVRILRQELGYTGFCHAKVMPGADPALIAATGRYANRLSVNIEVAKSATYAKIAKQKSKATILSPMGEISRQIREAAYRRTGTYANRQEKPDFAVSQTTQLMAGAAGEDDRTILNLSDALYRKYRLKRVYYTPFTYRYPSKGYEDLPLTQTPYWRVARLYQADRLTQLYRFAPEELTPADAPYLESDIDPKTAWALRHIDLFPVELNTADYDTLLRIPGIGTTYAARIMTARWYAPLSFDTLRQMKISLKRARYFVTCGGKFLGNELDPIGLRMLFSAPAQMEMGENRK